MKKRLTLLRHAKSVTADASLPDSDRPLNERGEREAPLMGRRLRARGVRPSLMLTSPAVRALHTARLIAREIGYPLDFVQRESELYPGSPQDVLRVLSRQDNAFNDILICGHNPGLTDLANRLTGGEIDNIPTCGIVVIEAKVSEWSEFGDEGGSLAEFDYPKRKNESDAVV